ncbi:hypothetical protein [Phyllobacterium sp. SB3]|uniref:hypothetical protein n=1 Tax=Phyllobacterium sp. SB3 TaxID=3156073 RepID=UPI0032AEF90A
MSDEIAQYQAALRALNTAEDKVRDMVKTINQVREAFYPSNFPSFVGWRFDINDQIEPGRRYDEKANISLDSWPSKEDMGELIRHWHATLLSAQSAWKKIPEESRLGISSPPTRMDIRSW